MALIKCNECGNKVSEKAGQCVRCGNPITAEQVAFAIQQEKKKQRNWMIGLGVVLLLGFIGSFQEDEEKWGAETAKEEWGVETAKQAASEKTAPNVSFNKTYQEEKQKSQRSNSTSKDLPIGVYVTDRGFYGAYRKEDIERATQIAATGDEDAFTALILEGALFPIKEGQKVDLVEGWPRDGAVKIRVRGTTRSFWTFGGAILR